MDQEEDKQKDKDTNGIAIQKLVNHIGSTRCASDAYHSASDWFYVNERAHDMLATVKTSIGNDHRWDRCKKFFNPYELISSPAADMPCCASYTPTSRSFFKLTEMLQDHHDDLTTQHASKAAFLCDAPGGFVEAFLTYRRRGNRPGGWIGKDIIHAISLVGPCTAEACDTKVRGGSVPAWRLPRDLLRNNNVHLHGGDPGGNNGDLYVLANIEAFVKKVGRHSCELVTADGGFDFSSDFNSQEQSSLRLLVSEVFTALQVLADGGALLIKMYDISLPATLRLLWHLNCCFSGGIVVDKPCTSRVANSERFIICRWFERSVRVERLVSLLRISVARGLGDVPLVGLGRHLPPSWFLRELALFNTRYIAQQTRVIMNTLAFMRSQEGEVFPHLVEQLACARLWCTRYRMTMNYAHTQIQSAGPGPCWDHPVSVPEVSVLGSVPNTVADEAGTADMQSAVSARSRSPSTTPYRDGLLLPGRKLEGAYCDRLPGGGTEVTLLKNVA